MPSSPQTTVLPGSWLGVLGGGQLGRMFVHAAQRLGYKVLVLEPQPDAPAAQVADDALQADYTDTDALMEMARRCAAITTEFENVPAATLEFLVPHVPVYPSAAAVATAQNRIEEKRFFTACGVAVAPYLAVVQASDLTGIDERWCPGILKTATLGYDGLGQCRVDTPEDARAAWDRLNRVPCVLERRLDLHQEISVIVARGADGAAQVYPVAENQHRNGILALTLLPARVDAKLAQRAQQAALALAHALEYVGVLCVEFFVLADGSFVVNEMAPRPHNSGHATIEACISSQFEQQVRILAGLPLGDVTQLAPAAMVNVLGDVWWPGDDAAAPRTPDWPAVLQVPGAQLHIYGKQEARRGRKMGHVTCVGTALGADHAAHSLITRVNQVAHALGIEPFA